MSGHSKWSKVKHQKAVTDVAKAAAFTRASRAITIAVKEGGGIDPNFNFRLRLAIEKAREVNMPKENIERAIEKAKDAAALVQEVYEGYGPYGIALYIEAATDNVNRTVSYIKQALEHAGGSMASPGAVAYLFDRRGVILIPPSYPQETVFERSLEAGAEDMSTYDDGYELYTKPESLYTVKQTLEEQGMTVTSCMLVMQPKMTLALPSEKRDHVEALIARLEEMDDIQRVYSTLETVS